MFAPAKPKVLVAFSAWLEREDARIFLSVATVHEIERGVALLESRGATAKARALRGWLAGLLAAYSDRILGLDAGSASRSGRLEAAALAAGHDPGMADAIVAGIAAEHDLAVVTRNARHFIAFGVNAFTPEEIAAP